MGKVVSIETVVIGGEDSIPLHLLGWKSFQDLGIAIAEECLRRPVQTFLPTNDAGRDGAFIGKWEGDDPASGESTIQCKFTSDPRSFLSRSKLQDELSKAEALAAKGLANDYIIITNHLITGRSELAIRKAFESIGVGRCRLFGYNWIVRQLRLSPRLRMMAPRVYGLADLSTIFEDRAYRQAQLILSAMGDDLSKLVVTDAHRRSVRAISEHNLVLLLGAPAAGKSTIGASIAVGAVDIWKARTIRAMSPNDIHEKLEPGANQFFWIDDAWGNAQYQRQNSEAWNQVFPLMQGAMRKGARFLITSRDYIWNSAKQDLKLQAIPILGKSQVVINVEEFSTQEKAQILYNHLKFGDQPLTFRSNVKPVLPEIAERKDFLPEVARRLGSTFFAGKLSTSANSVTAFFQHPEQFLLEIISNLSAECRAALSLIFLSAGQVRSPVSQLELDEVAAVFGVDPGRVKEELQNLNGSLLLRINDEVGAYWTYKHRTVGDAFAKHVASSPELTEIYLRGAKPESIKIEVVCAGIVISGAPVVVPDKLHRLLAKRLEGLDDYSLSNFLSYRANKTFCELMLKKRPALFSRLNSFYTPIKEDADTNFLVRLHEFGLLPEEIRLKFVKTVHKAAVEEADSSFIDIDEIGAVLSSDERAAILSDVERDALSNVESYVNRIRSDWSPSYNPEDHFEGLMDSIRTFAQEVGDETLKNNLIAEAKDEIRRAIAIMNEEYEPPSTTSVTMGTSSTKSTILTNLFRDVDA